MYLILMIILYISCGNYLCYYSKNSTFFGCLLISRELRTTNLNCSRSAVYREGYRLVFLHAQLISYCSPFPLSMFMNCPDQKLLYHQIPEKLFHPKGYCPVRHYIKSLFFYKSNIYL